MPWRLVTPGRPAARCGASPDRPSGRRGGRRARSGSAAARSWARGHPEPPAAIRDARSAPSSSAGQAVRPAPAAQSELGGDRPGGRRRAEEDPPRGWAARRKSASRRSSRVATSTGVSTRSSAPGSPGSAALPENRVTNDVQPPVALGEADVPRGLTRLLPRPDRDSPGPWRPGRAPRTPPAGGGSAVVVAQQDVQAVLLDPAVPPAAAGALAAEPPAALVDGDRLEAAPASRRRELPRGGEPGHAAPEDDDPRQGHVSGPGARRRPPPRPSPATGGRSALASASTVRQPAGRPADGTRASCDGGAQPGHPRPLLGRDPHRLGQVGHRPVGVPAPGQPSTAPAGGAARAGGGPRRPV